MDASISRDMLRLYGDMGAGVQANVMFQCGGPDFAHIQVAQRDGRRVITGGESAIIECGRSAKWTTLRGAAFASDVAFRARPLFVNVRLAYYDDYQSVANFGYATRAIDVLGPERPRVPSV